MVRLRWIDQRVICFRIQATCSMKPGFLKKVPAQVIGLKDRLLLFHLKKIAVVIGNKSNNT